MWLYSRLYIIKYSQKREYSHGDYYRRQYSQEYFQKKILEKFSKKDYYHNFYRISSTFENILQKDYCCNFTSLYNTDYDLWHQKLERYETGNEYMILDDRRMKYVDSMYLQYYNSVMTLWAT